MIECHQTRRDGGHVFNGGLFSFNLLETYEIAYPISAFGELEKYKIKLISPAFQRFSIKYIYLFYKEGGGFLICVLFICFVSLSYFSFEHCPLLREVRC